MNVRYCIYGRLETDMGRFFSNVQIKKSDGLGLEGIIEGFSEILTNRNYQVVESEDLAEGELVIYAPKNSKWISVCSELIEFNGTKDVREWLYSLVDVLNTDVIGIGCFDSDYMFLNLVNAEDRQVGWINIGFKDDYPGFDRNRYKAWRTQINDFDSIKKRISDNYVFAEDFLDVIGEKINMTATQACISSEYPDVDDDEETIYRIYYSSIEEERAEAEKKPAEFMCLWSPFLLLKGIDGNSFTMYNKGGESRGLIILFDLIEGDIDEVTFSDVYLEYYYRGARPVSIPIELKKVCFVDDKYRYMWEDSEFLIEATNFMDPKFGQNRSLTDRDGYTIRFKAHGNKRKFLDIRVTLAPMENPMDGQDSWYIWKGNKSKRNFIEKYNLKLNTFKEKILNPDDYDL